MVGTGTTRSDLASWWGLPAYRLAQCGFGSVQFRFLVFAIGPVRFMFGFGSCGSWSISVRFGSVFGTFYIDICFFSGAGKANTDCFLQEVYCFPQEVSWAAAFKERRELISENQSFLKLPVHAIYYEETHIVFFHWTQKTITTFTTFPISLLGEGKTVPVPPVRFCTRFQRFTVPTVHRLFDFLRFGSTVPVRFLNLTACNMVGGQGVSWPQWSAIIFHKNLSIPCPNPSLAFNSSSIEFWRVFVSVCVQVQVN